MTAKYEPKSERYRHSPTLVRTNRRDCWTNGCNRLTAIIDSKVGGVVQKGQERGGTGEWGATEGAVQLDARLNIAERAASNTDRALNIKLEKTLEKLAKTV